MTTYLRGQIWLVNFEPSVGHEYQKIRPALKEATCAKFAQVQTEGKRTVSRKIEYYNLDAIIAVGYRVNSKRATQFRIWATNILTEYIIKGFAMDDQRLKEMGGGNYWKELLDRIRDIRSSKKVLYRQVLDLFATSQDYNPKSGESIAFFKVVQNKLHYAAHGNTAAEVIARLPDGPTQVSHLWACSHFQGAM